MSENVTTQLLKQKSLPVLHESLPPKNRQFSSVEQYVSDKIFCTRSEDVATACLS